MMKSQLLQSCLLLVAVVMIPHAVHCAGGCADGNCSASERSKTCETDGLNIPLGESFYRTALRDNGTKAVDICFVVSAAHTMNSSQRWLQIAVPYLEMMLINMGIGNGTDINRYCLVQFGARGQYLTARFVMARGLVMFPAEYFFDARRKLRKNGDVADGYEAVEFTIENAPFREDPHIPKMVVLVTDMGRSVLALKANLTREVLYSKMAEQGIVFDTAVKARMFLEDSMYRAEKVIGLNDFTTATILRPEGGYERVQGNVFFNSNEGQTVADYITLTLHMGGSSWALTLLDNEDLFVLQSFAGAFIETHGLRQLESYRVCERCLCSHTGEGTALQCTEPLFQDVCHCLVQGNPAECGSIMPSPSPVVPNTSAVTSLLSAVRPSPVARGLTLEGSIEYTPDGDVEISFTSNIDKTSFECIILNDIQLMPTVLSCESPYALKNLSEGEYRVVVIGKHQQQQATKVFTIDILPSVETLELDASARPPELNGSVIVDFSANRRPSSIHYQCSLHGGLFFGCQSPYLIDQSDIGDDTKFFIILATDRKGAAASAIITIQSSLQPTPSPPGPVMIHVMTDPPDAFGIIRIRFTVTRPAVCICQVQVNSSATNVTKPESCKGNDTLKGIYVADPRNLSAGLHVLMIVCQDSKNYIASSNVKFVLNRPPAAVIGPLMCRLILVGPNERGLLVANFTCSRGVSAHCQVSSYDPEPCNRLYQFDTSALAPGNHVFILIAEDRLGNSVMKIFPFTIGLARRKCCPHILSNSSVNVSTENPLDVSLQLFVAPGNCSLAEGFTYEIDWGDSAIESGSSTQLNSVEAVRTYREVGHYTVQASYCNDPAAKSDICCATLSLPVHLLTFF